MKPILCPVLILAALVLPMRTVGAQVLEGTSKGDLESNLSVLNLFETRPEPVQRFYAAAYGVLAADPRATFVAVCGDPEVQRLCSELGLTHLGGPMLGAVTADGARVWLRTVGPASVEVRVTVNGEERAFGPVQSSAATDLVAVVPVAGLEPATRYP
ncbi:MAG TPA: hypothetical protein PLF51_18925, partial [Candidatus Hydrogenedentes bacterium]|nr:hypothetical protein [Candidatus Hydrogenedentota bacterium]